MARPKQLVSDDIWKQRINSAVRYKAEWEKLFKCDILDKYYEGQQWKSQSELAYNPYVINKVYETIQIKISQFIPTFPVFTVSTKAAAEDDLEEASHSAQLKEDVLNPIVQNPLGHVPEEFEQAYKDSFFRFGILEVGYEADWIINPNAPKPFIGADSKQNLSESERQRILEEPPEIPSEERVFVKHIPAKTFFIGGMDHRYLNRCGWVGYYEYVDRDDLLALPKLLNRDKVSAYQPSVTGEPNRESGRLDSVSHRANSVKVWHIWDNKTNQRILWMEDPGVTIFIRKFRRLSLYDYRPDRRLIVNGFYPIPPAYHWLSPQDEYNETREMLRTHRRRFIRKYQVLEGRVDDEEIEKFETGPDGALIKVKAENAISPIQNADLGAALNEAIATSADDLNRISGTSDESRGVADRTTATQATIVNQRTALRETKDRDRIVGWFCQVAREILLVIQENFSGNVIAKLTSQEGENFGQSVQTNKAPYRLVNSDELRDGFDFRIDVDLSSLSQSAQEAELTKLTKFLTILTQFPMVAFSPYLIREIAYRVGYRNDKAIAEFQQMALLMELGRMNQLKMQAGPPQGQPGQDGGMPANGNNGQQILAQMTPPDAEAIRNQITNQLGGGGGGIQ